MSRQSCTNCKTIPLDILILQCDHNLCMKCASQICQLHSCTILCPKCKLQTFLDEQLIAQIQQFCVQYQAQEVRGRHNQGGEKQNTHQDGEDFSDYSRTLYSKNLKQTLNRKKSKGNKQKHNINYSTPNNIEYQKSSNQQNTNASKLMNETHQKYKRPPKYRQGKQQSISNTQNDSDLYGRQLIQHQIGNKNRNQKIISYRGNQPISDSCISEVSVFSCKQHYQYQIMYICLQCENRFVCPECIIHGVHKNHQVQTMKKSVNKIQAQLSSKIYSLDCSIQGLIQASQDKKNRLKIKIDKINKLKQQAISKYNIIREQLAKQQNQIIQKCSNLINCFQRDFNQMQTWIKNDLISIEKQKDYMNFILNPIPCPKGQNAGKKPNKSQQKLIEMRIVEQYFNNLKKNDKIKKKNYLWINNKQKQFQQFQPKSQQGLEILTDRVKSIKSIYSSCNSQVNDFASKMQSMGLKNLQGSRFREYYENITSSKLGSTMQNKETSKKKINQSPFNMLKSGFEKQNLIPQAESILIRQSRNKDLRKSRKKGVNFQQQNNFLIF